MMWDQWKCSNVASVAVVHIRYIELRGRAKESGESDCKEPRCRVEMLHWRLAKSARMHFPQTGCLRWTYEVKLYYDISLSLQKSIWACYSYTPHHLRTKVTNFHIKAIYIPY